MSQQTQAPLISVFILMLGNGLFTSFVPIFLQDHGYSDWFIGLISSIYYMGLLYGAFCMIRLINRVGHIRAYSTFAALMAISVLLPDVWNHTVTWITGRFMNGLCLAGLYIVIESWILSVSEGKESGKNLAFYMIATSLGATLGQLFLNLGTSKTGILFNIAVMLICLSIIPLTTTRARSPDLHRPSALTVRELYRISASGVLGCFFGGALMAGIFSFLPYFAHTIGFTVQQTSFLMVLAIGGGVLFQYPIGYFSDKMDRRYILMGLCVALLIGVFILSFSYQSYSYTLLVGLFLVGGSAAAIYPVSISHACDFTPPEDIVNLTQGLLIAYGGGSIVGPLIVPLFLNIHKTFGLFLFFAVFTIILLSLIFYKIISSRKKGEYRQPFAPAHFTTPVASELDPRTD